MIMSKIVLVKQWLKQKTYKNGKISISLLFIFFAEMMGYVGVFKLFCKLIVIILNNLYKVLPFLIEFIQLLENLASSLSYKRRGFFLWILLNLAFTGYQIKNTCQNYCSWN